MALNGFSALMLRDCVPPVNAAGARRQGGFRSVPVSGTATTCCLLATQRTDLTPSGTGFVSDVAAPGDGRRPERARLGHSNNRPPTRWPGNRPKPIRKQLTCTRGWGGLTRDCILCYNNIVLLRDTLVSVLKDQRPTPSLKPEVIRKLGVPVPAMAARALALRGVRRCGKSVLQTQLMRRRETAFYCNLEDTRLFGLSPADFPTMLSVIDELAPGDVPVFLDEVQQAPEWERLVRALLDRGRAVCVTGSNASLLSRELGAKLTGRHLSLEVFPFSYEEYLAFTRASAGEASLLAYLDDGGFPGYLWERSPQVLQQLLRDIVQRDITVRHGLRETRHVMHLALFLLANTGQALSLQSLTKSLGIPAVAQTGRYLEYLQDAYVLFSVPKFSPSFKRRVVAPNKYYAIDNGFRRLNSPQTTPDRGHRLENLVFLALRRCGENVSYAGEKDLWECDFVTDASAIQVCAELTPHNRGRELAGLVRACRLPGERRALVLTLNQRDRIIEQGTSVEVRPVWEWLLHGPAQAAHHPK
jgi:uncharacterized protein